ncbi:MAG: phosphate ABC transporter ATP-binding protein [Clostridiales bacterium]|nr:phosphate ABC transporter ATP-binding protein [Clostridiales bacterium]
MIIEKGEFVNIIGPSGSGKSTFLRLLNRLSSISSGEINYCGENINEINPVLLRKEVGFVFQKPYLFGETVKENIEYSSNIHNLAVDKDYIFNMLEQLNLERSILEKNCKDLSGGEQQRICLIRTLMLKPRVLLLDEITSSLDPVNTKIVEEFITKIYNDWGITIVLVTHDLQQTKRMGKRTIFLEKGKVLKDAETNSYFKEQSQDQINDFFNEWW